MWRDQKEFDCIVVGGGPAGTTFARIAAAEGLSVLLLEKDIYLGHPFCLMVYFHIDYLFVSKNYHIFQN